MPPHVAAHSDRQGCSCSGSQAQNHRASKDGKDLSHPQIQPQPIPPPHTSLSATAPWFCNTPRETEPTAPCSNPDHCTLGAGSGAQNRALHPTSALQSCRSPTAPLPAPVGTAWFSSIGARPEALTCLGEASLLPTSMSQASECEQVMELRQQIIKRGMKWEAATGKEIYPLSRPEG